MSQLSNVNGPPFLVKNPPADPLCSKGETLSTSFPLRQRLFEIYRHLLTAYGPQHWWPAEEPFEVMVGAILTQSTAWANVAKAIGNLKAANAMSPQAIRRLGTEELAAFIRPSGYYTAKARKLKALVSWLEEHNDDLSKLFAKDLAQLRQELLAVYGIGDETADSILLYAAGKPVFVIDAYTRRTIDRIGIWPEAATYTGYQRLFISNLSPDVAVFNEYHALFVEHGKRTCRKPPLCPGCPVLDMCEYGLSTTRRIRRVQGTRRTTGRSQRRRSTWSKLLRMLPYPHSSITAQARTQDTCRL